MDVFSVRDRLIDDYSNYVKSFIAISDEKIRDRVDSEIKSGLLWPDPLIQLNPAFEPGDSISDLVEEKVLHPACAAIFRIRHEDGTSQPIRFYRHQSQAIRTARQGHNYVLTTGTGSGKSLGYIVPIVDHVLRNGTGKGIQAIIVYPMNALANSQRNELAKFLTPESSPHAPVTFKSYTGQESAKEKEEIRKNPPDILLTNYVMLELIMTRSDERGLIEAAEGLSYLVFDELHTYRGRQGADVAMLIRRVRERLENGPLQCIGTSATMSSEGTSIDRRARVAEVSSQIFGTTITPANVIGETLQPATRLQDLDDPSFRTVLTNRVADIQAAPPRNFASFVSDPLSIWIENIFGITIERATGELIRATPIGIEGSDGAAQLLSKATGVAEPQCRTVIERGLLAGYECEPNPSTGFRPFAFRLHQFIGRGDTVYATLEPEELREITLEKQSKAPGSGKVLRPLVFCRECGHEYYAVRHARDIDGERFDSRDLQDQFDSNGTVAGFLYRSSRDPWPDDRDGILQRLPDDWLEERNDTVDIRKSLRQHLPQRVVVDAYGRAGDEGHVFHFVTASLRFCLSCGVSYGTWQQNDFMKLATLSSEGRSTATTILGLSSLRELEAENLDQMARKLLSFTDNRQDASLQAGHFNDFVEIARLRASLFKAVSQAGSDGIHHHDLQSRVFKAIDLPFPVYARDSDVKYHARQETERALREMLEYRVYCDQRRGWRITQPNLEQCGLLKIEYNSLDELCATDQDWLSYSATPGKESIACHEALSKALPELRKKIACTLLDYMRRELAISKECLSVSYQGTLRALSSQHLNSAWGLRDGENLETSRLVVARSRSGNDKGIVAVSPRGGYGQYLRRELNNTAGHLTLNDIGKIIGDLLAVLEMAGIVSSTELLSPEGKVERAYQVASSAMRWIAGDGTRSFHDPIRVPNRPEEHGHPNSYFVNFYQTTANKLLGVSAAEHTAQVSYERRIKREKDFSAGKLPVLFCSPTMELGVDIKELNVVNMRNVPPTPANYAQRSGRAGRGGQPALVYTYCTSGSPHDRYFFRRPSAMVSGTVAPPKIDLSNEDLLRSHIHSIWLAETGLSLGTSLKDVLDLSNPNQLRVHDNVTDALNDTDAIERTRTRAQRLLDTLLNFLSNTTWYSETWLNQVLGHIPSAFDEACKRWGELYGAAHQQVEIQHRISIDQARSSRDRDYADRLRREARQQLAILTAEDERGSSDFYSYRYFAGEGFLPGYNFPRLPISAYIQAADPSSRDEYLSRPRFLAISEFGPRAIVYHEGAQYVIDRVILGAAGTEDGTLATSNAKLCSSCGYLHPITEEPGPSNCEQCGHELKYTHKSLFRLRNVSTRRRERISSDEEERMRMGYEIITGLRFTRHGIRPARRTATVHSGGEQLARATYGDGATLWRINLGWTRRKKKDKYGFVLDIERGYWAKNEDTETNDPDDPMSSRQERVIPYVEDSRNCLVIEPHETLPLASLVSFQAALKNAIQAIYYLEDSELASELLPQETPRSILFYEASEGGAGVLRRIIDEPDALASIARMALGLCHFDPDSGEDLRRAPHARENCGAACYDCLLSYKNQFHHDILDRHLVRDILMSMITATIEIDPEPELIDFPTNNGTSSLVTDQWLKYLEARGYYPPDARNESLDGIDDPADFLYRSNWVAVLIGDHSDTTRRRSIEYAWEDKGFTVLWFDSDPSTWETVLLAHPKVFGTTRSGR